MKTGVQYIMDKQGNVKTVQLSIVQWTRLVTRLNKYEQMLKIKSDLTEAFREVKKVREGKIRKQSLQDFVNDL